MRRIASWGEFSLSPPGGLPIVGDFYNPVTVDRSIRVLSDYGSDIIKPSGVVAVVFSAHRSSDHVGKLNAHAIVARRQKDALDQIVVAADILRLRMNEFLMLTPHPFIVLPTAVVRDD